MSVSPDQIVLGTISGFTDRFTVSVLAGEGFNGTVFFSVSGVPDGVTVVFRDRGFYLVSLTIFATYLEVTSSPDARLGNYTLAVSAASQGPSVFYAVATRVTLIIQEIGQMRTSLEGNRTQVTNPSAAGQGHVISLMILALATGIVMGSVTTYILVRKKTQPEATSAQSLSVKTTMTL